MSATFIDSPRALVTLNYMAINREVVTFWLLVGSIYQPTAPSDIAGHTFAGWYTAATGGERVTMMTVPSGGTVLFARWTLSGQRRLYFDAAGGELSGETSRLVEIGAPLGALPTPTRAGHTFAGWATRPVGGEAVTSETLMPGDVMTIYATWTAAQLVVQFVASPGTCRETERVRRCGQQLGRLPGAARDGFALDGWYTAASGGTRAERTDVVTAPLTLYARWRAAFARIALQDL